VATIQGDDLTRFGYILDMQTDQSLGMPQSFLNSQSIPSDDLARFWLHTRYETHQSY
jgi:hypothetical protein